MSDHDARFLQDGRTDYRSPAQIDRDRILYTPAFSRLAEITQVVSADRGYIFHNRLTHSLKVAQLARRIAEKLQPNSAKIEALRGLDPDVAEAAALAHDLGHPPFGHIAEQELDLCARKAGLEDGFNGNAQSFRIVTKLAVGDGVSPEGTALAGLNLTRATLNGILKYPWIFGANAVEKNKWGAYFTERLEFEWARATLAPAVRSLEAEIMDWADDITYAVHDLIDFFCAGLIPLDRLADYDDRTEFNLFIHKLFSRRPDLETKRTSLEKSLSEVLQQFPLDRRYEGAFEQRRDLWLFNTILISRYVNAIQLSKLGQAKGLVIIEPNAKDEILMLKEVTWQYVIESSELATQQYGQRQAVRRVFRTLIAAARRGGNRLFPPAYQRELEHAGTDELLKKRIVTDYVASMTERELLQLHGALRG